MSDLGDTFKAFREDSQKKRAGNKLSSLKLLQDRGHTVQLFSASHFRIGQFDFWPSTGKYLNLKTKRYGRGVFNLLAELAKSEGK